MRVREQTTVRVEYSTVPENNRPYCTVPLPSTPTHMPCRDNVVLHSSGHRVQYCTAPGVGHFIAIGSMHTVPVPLSRSTVLCEGGVGVCIGVAAWRFGVGLKRGMEGYCTLQQELYHILYF